MFRNQVCLSLSNVIRRVKASLELELLADKLRPITDSSHLRNTERSPPDSHCLPGTRDRLIEQIKAWANSGILFRRGVPSHIFWLYGYVGCGKSAIAQTIAENFDKENRLAGSFFFFRGMGDRSKSSRFAVTLAWQLAKTIPATIPLIDIARISCGTTIDDASVPTQFEHLFLQPFYSALQSPGRLIQSLMAKPYLTVIDGLDECEDRQDIKGLIEKIMGFFREKPRFPLRFFISSRAEEHIGTTFIHEKNKTVPGVDIMDLAAETTDEDIAFVVDESFSNAAKARRVVRAYGDWPSQEDRQRLVKNAQKSFIVISILLKFILEPTDDARTPLDRLPLALDLANGLDGLYSEILSRSKGVPHFDDILSTIALVKFPFTVDQLALFLDLEAWSVMAVLVKLCSIIHVPDDDKQPVTLFHSSLREYLCTESRSGDFFVSSSLHKRLAFRSFELAKARASREQKDEVLRSLIVYGKTYSLDHWSAHVAVHRDDPLQTKKDLRDVIMHFCGPAARFPPSTICYHIFAFAVMDREWVTTISRPFSKSPISELALRFADSSLTEADLSPASRVTAALNESLSVLAKHGDVNPGEELLPILAEIQPTLPPQPSIQRPLSRFALVVDNCLSHLFTHQEGSHQLKIIFVPRIDRPIPARLQGKARGELDVADYSYWSLSMYLARVIGEEGLGPMREHISGQRQHSNSIRPKEPMQPLNYLSRLDRYFENEAHFNKFKSNFERATAVVESIIAVSCILQVLWLQAILTWNAAGNCGFVGFQ